MTEYLNKQYPKIFGAKYSENLEADIVERHTGLMYEDKPGKIDLESFRNRIALFLPGHNSCSYFDLKEVLFRPDPKYRSSYFLPINNTIAVWNDHPYYAIHENAHGLVNQHNPSILDAICDEESIGIERMVVYDIANEGLADWIRYDIEISRGDLPEETHTENLQFQAFRVAEREKLFQDLLFGDQYRRCLSRFKVDPLGLTLETDQHGDIKYHGMIQFSGYVFIAKVIESLRNRGLNLNQTLSGIIHNYPSRIADLEDPNSYAKDLSKLI